MNTFERLKTEIELQYGSIYKFCKDSGLPRSTFTRMSSNGFESVNNRTLVKIANVLALDYEELKKGNVVYKDEETLEAENVPKESYLSPVEADIINQARKLSTKAQFKVLEYIEDLSQIEKYRREL